MSYENFVKALELAKDCKNYHDSGGRTETVVSKAEELFGTKFSRQIREFYKRLGYLSFYGNEIYGIWEDFSGSGGIGSITTALADRKDYNLPKEWLPIYFYDDGYMGYLDYSQLNDEGEPPVIMAIYNGDEFVVVERIADDFGDFLLELVEWQLEEQLEEDED